jgi:thymidylate kinase
MIVVFLGPDGSGKTAAIEDLMDSNIFTSYHYFHLKPIQNMHQDSIVSDPHKEDPYSTFKSYIKILFYIFMYNFGWLKNIQSVNNDKTLIIFDRFYDDIYVDPLRFRYGASLTVAKFARLFIPNPDLTIILTTDYRVINSRKREVSIQESKRQIEEYKKIIGEGIVHIDSGKGLDDLYNEVKKNIIKIKNG